MARLLKTKMFDIWLGCNKLIYLIFLSSKQSKYEYIPYCQTPGLVLSLGVDFVLPLSQEGEKEHQQQGF